MGNTVRVNGVVVFEGRLHIAAEIYRMHAQKLTRRAVGDVVSLRDGKDVTLAKASVGDSGQVITWK